MIPAVLKYIVEFISDDPERDVKTVRSSPLLSFPPLVSSLMSLFLLLFHSSFSQQQVSLPLTLLRQSAMKNDLTFAPSLNQRSECSINEERPSLPLREAVWLKWELPARWQLLVS